MEVRKPKPKKVTLPPKKSNLPLKKEREIVGVFNGHSVTVSDLDSMIHLYEAGNFGKGSLSKGEPNYHVRKDDIPKILLQHQFENQAKWNASTSYFQQETCRGSLKNDFQLSLQSINNLLQSSFMGNEQESWKSWKKNQEQVCPVLKDQNELQKMDFLLESEADEENYKDEDFINIVNSILQLKQLREPKMHASNEEVIVLNTSFNPQANDLSVVNAEATFEKLPFVTKENLNLNLEESFFLKSVLGCLNVVDLNFSEISTSDLWEKFNATDRNFLERYIAYHFYRSKGWVVRSGLKFGGDYLLYKDGPAYYHASYLVKVLDRRKKLTWREFISMNRLVETFNKDLLLSNVLPWKTTEENSFPEVLENHSVQHVLVKRWFPSKERFSKTDEASS